MKRIIRLTEKDLTKLVKKIMKEGDPGDGTRDDFSEYEGRTDIYADNIGTEKKDDDLTSQSVVEYWARRKTRISEQLISTTDRVFNSRQICYNYKVQDGDKMWNIASKMREKFAPNQNMDDYWLDWKSNMTEFNIVDLNKIKTGDIIPIPMSCGKMSN
jgi:hypothetical protein